MPASRLRHALLVASLVLALPLTGCDCAGPTPDSRLDAGGDAGPPRRDAQPLDGPLPDTGPGADAGPNCMGLTCGPGERCEITGGAPMCVPNECADLTCTATERCEPSPDGRGNVCADNSCTDSIECAPAEYCDGTVCLADICVPGTSSCTMAGEIESCSDDGGALVTRFACGGEAYFTSACTEEGGSAYCPCEDDWDCPAFTVCEAGRCAGTGVMPTCRLPAAAFDSVLPTPEPGFPWGGRSSSDRDATGSPFPASSQVVMTPVVANLDDDNGDGLIDERDIPEIVFLTFCGSEYTNNGVLRAVHGGGPRRGEDFFASCGGTHWQESDGEPFPTCGCAAAELDSTAGLAVGDLDGDGVPEIVAMGENDRIRIYSNLGELIVDLGGAAVGGNASPSIANLDGAGFAEIIVGASVFTLEHDAGGVLQLVDRFDGTQGRGTNGQGPISCIADIAGGDELEIVGGSSTYRVPTPPAGVTRQSECAGADTSDFCRGRLELVWDARTISTAAIREGFCAIADVLGVDPSMPPGPTNALDGLPEVIVIASGRLQIFEGATGTMRLDVALPIGTRGGAPNVDDFDGDGFPEIGTAGATAYNMYDLQTPTALCPAWPNVFRDSMTGLQGNPARMAPAAACTTDADCGDTTQFACNAEIRQCVCLHNGWLRDTEDDSSQVTGSSVFDFNGDGAAEVVYNDECYFRIYSGLDGSVLFREASESRTRTENPVVADVDNDGNAEIVFATSNESGFCSDRSLAPSFNNGLEVWGDSSDLWVSARRIWNEHAYHVTNVLESGGIPLREPESWRTYGMREYNTYRSQPRSFGVAPNLVVDRIQLSSPGAMCGALGSTLVITARIRNIGDLRVGPDVVVGFEGTWITPALTEPLGADAGGTALTTTLGRTLEPGSSVIVTVTYDSMFNSPGILPNTVRVIADSLMSERECIEDDNAREREVTAGGPTPDLALELGTVAGLCPGRTFETIVRNVGSTSASDVVVRYYFGDPSGGGMAVLDQTIAGPIAPGGMVTISPMISLPARAVTVFAVVDPDDRIEECDDSNNSDSSDPIECGPS